MSLTDRLANLHLLLGSNSFRRWPLKVTFYAEDVGRVWRGWCAREDVGGLPAGVEVATAETVIGIESVDVGYGEMKGYLEKTKSTLEAAAPSSCSICRKDLAQDGNMILFCPSSTCSAAGHIECFSSSFTRNQQDSIIPECGQCPECATQLEWVDLVKELSLRMRGEKEIAKVLKVRKGRATKKAAPMVAETDAMEDEPSDEADEDLDDRWHELSDFSEDEQTLKVVRREPSPRVAFKSARAEPMTPHVELVVEDSDWDDAMMLT